MSELAPNRRMVVALLLLAVGCGGGSDPVSASLNTGTGGSTGTPSTPVTTVPEAGTFVKRTITVGTASYPYQVFVPAAYRSNTKWPVILFLNGSGSRGTDGEAQVKTALGPVVQAQAATFPAITVFPQIPAVEGFPAATMIQIAVGALDQVMQQYNVDATRQYLTGASAGGVLTYQIAYENPTRYAALVPVASVICDVCVTGDAKAVAGSATPIVAQRLRTMPTWIFHGKNDPTFPVAYPRAIYAAFQAAGGNVQYTEYPNGAHNGATWDTAYNTPALYTWMLAQHR